MSDKQRLSIGDVVMLSDDAIVYDKEGLRELPGTFHMTEQETREVLPGDPVWVFEEGQKPVAGVFLQGWPPYSCIIEVNGLPEVLSVQSIKVVDRKDNPELFI